MSHKVTDKYPCSWFEFDDQYDLYTLYIQLNKDSGFRLLFSEEIARYSRNLLDLKEGEDWPVLEGKALGKV